MKLTKVILVTYPEDFILNEGKQLVLSIPNYEIVKIFTQKYLNHAKYGIGSGKAEEITQFVQQTTGIEEIIVDNHLTSKQIYNLEKLIGVTVKDRERLILDIFFTRATTVEAKLQIQLAEIEYEMPRIREKAKLLSNSKERAGKGGMGEYIVDVHFRDLKRQMSFIREKLNDAKLKRKIYQYQRQKIKMYIVSLVGYTSSGKTTLFNLLTDESKEISPNLFTTLSTTTRSLKDSPHSKNITKKGGEGILIVDTVGFISRLPPYMIDAFKSTLEESIVADLILLLLDSSEEIEDMRIKYLNCLQILEELNVDKSKLVIVFTKVDKIDKRIISEIVRKLEISKNNNSNNNIIWISSKTGYGIHKLKTLFMKKQLLQTTHENKNVNL
ncbi:MAG: GTPase HflX [Nitrososphaeraceae archaeon]|nr:GTPase HflX [Nitrososphaeraceae archaeon]